VQQRFGCTLVARLVVGLCSQVVRVIAVRRLLAGQMQVDFSVGVALVEQVGVANRQVSRAAARLCAGAYADSPRKRPEYACGNCCAIGRNSEEATNARLSSARRAAGQHGSASDRLLAFLAVLGLALGLWDLDADRFCGSWMKQWFHDAASSRRQIGAYRRHNHQQRNHNARRRAIAESLDGKVQRAYLHFKL